MLNLRAILVASLFAIVSVLAVPSAIAGAKITILNKNEPGIGFNDPTPAAPVGGNSGTTIGEQRLKVFQKAAEIWGGLLDSDLEITVAATFEPLTCSETSATVGSAGPTEIFSDFENAEFPNLWYHVALAEKLARVKLLEGTDGHLRARFNSKLGEPGCLPGRRFYYGLDSNHGTNVDLLATLLHELAHGLGFSTFVNKNTGAPLEKQLDIYSHHIFDNELGRYWTQMSDAERAASAIKTGQVVWDGENVNREAARFLVATPLPLTVLSPPSVAGDYPIGVGLFGLQLPSTGITGVLVQARDAADPVNPPALPSTTDACSVITNMSEVSGKIALVDRGGCDFVVKTKNAQNAGAIAVVVVDTQEEVFNMIGMDPTIIIPTVKIGLTNGNKLKAALSSGVTVTLRSTDTPKRAGTDDKGRVLLYAPNPVEGGSSISHWDTSAAPNLLMEPAISSDLKNGVDLTLPHFADIGWFRSTTTAPSITVTKQDSLQLDRDSDGFADPGDVIHYTIVVRNRGGSATSVVLRDTIDSNTTLVPGSVRTSAGTIPSPSSPIEVAAGEIAANGTVTIEFDVTVNGATPQSATHISNQALVSGSNFEPVNSDDPDTVGPDATRTSTSFQPMAAEMTAALALDADQSGSISRGDTIRYTVTIRNLGLTAASGVTFTSSAGANLSLVPGSATTSAGSVTQLSTTDITVSVGTIQPGASVTIVYLATISSSTPATTGSVSSQGTISGAGFPTLLTDNPNTGTKGDPTVTFFSGPRRRPARR